MEGISYIDTKNDVASFRKWQIIEDGMQEMGH